MKKELIGFSVCVMLVVISFVPAINADEKTTDESIELTAYLSEEDYVELNDKLSTLNDQLLAAVTLDDIETILRSMAVLLNDYGLLPADTTIDETVASMKNSYIEQEQLQKQSGNNIEANQGELAGSTIIMNEPLSAPSSYVGWNYLEPWLRKSFGFEIIGDAWGTESFDSLRISKHRTSGWVFFLRGGLPHVIKYNRQQLAFDYWYWVIGRGEFDVTCTWTWLGQSYQCGGSFIVNGLKVTLKMGNTLVVSQNSEHQQVQEQQQSSQSNEQLIGTTQQYTTGSTTNK